MQTRETLESKICEIFVSDKFHFTLSISDPNEMKLSYIKEEFSCRNIICWIQFFNLLNSYISDRTQELYSTYYHLPELRFSCQLLQVIIWTDTVQQMDQRCSDGIFLLGIAHIKGRDLFRISKRMTFFLPNCRVIVFRILVYY